MTFQAIVLLALGLAMDATAVAAARGLAAPRQRARDVALVAALFGGFQALMPLIGWLVGRTVGPLVERWHHWVVFALLGAIGAKMLWEARGAADETELPSDRDVFDLRVMLLLAVATSIDALGVGVTLPLLHAPMLLSVVTIGVVTAALSALGLYAGRRFGSALGRKLDVVGGLVLIGLGARTLIEHFHRT
nr:manganese efflux pump [Deltaproteobacteria bacterium]